MIEFHDYDPAHPFDVESETQTVTDGKIILNYVPLQGSIVIDGFHAVQSKSDLAHGAFFVDYHAEDNYLSADGIVYFADEDNGQRVTASYKGVSTLLRADHMNEIKRFIEVGAGELAARILVTHEQMMFEKTAAWREGVLAEMQGIRAELAATKTQLAEIKDTLAKMKCCCKEADELPLVLDGGDTDTDETTDEEKDSYDGGDIDVSDGEPEYANDAGEITGDDNARSLSGNEPAPETSGDALDNSVAPIVNYDGGEIA